MAPHRALAGIVMMITVAAAAGCAPEPFEPQGPQATAARQGAWPEIDRILAEVRGKREQVAQGRFDGCRNGQNNWKRQDQYSHECFVVGSILVPAADTEDDVSEALQSLSARLDELGCTTTSDTLAQVDREYWQGLRDRDDYGPGNLPETRYQCSDTEISVKPSDPSTLADDLPPATVIFLDELLDEEPFPADTAKHADVEDVAMLWVITANRRYYATEF